MASRKKNPETSRITRGTTVAYARKQKPEGGHDGSIDGGSEPEPASEAPEAEGVKAEAVKTEAVKTEAVKTEAVKPEAVKTEAVKPDASKPDAPKPDASPAAPAPAAAVPPPAAARTTTLAMPVSAPVGTPPDMPASAAPPPPPRAEVAEAPTNMPGPNQIPAGSPGDPAAPPGRVPPGDSRSMRRRDATTYEFALIYRQGTFVITRFGVVGTRGQWRVVEYPTSASASHAYAKECSRFVSEGFSDYRD